MGQLCAISGSIFDIGLNPSQGMQVRVRPSSDRISHVGGDLVVAGVRTFDVADDGGVAFSLVSGSYIMDVFSDHGDSASFVPLTVPNATFARLDQIISRPTTITTTRKTDVRFSLSVKSADGKAVKLTGFTASAFDASPEIEGRITASIPDPTSGIIAVEIEGTDPIPVGEYEFRISYQNGDGYSVGLPGPFKLVVR